MRNRADTRDESRYETAWVLGAGQSAVIADVSEDTTFAVDERMRRLGGSVHRRAYGDVGDNKWVGDYPDHPYLYPHEYLPAHSPGWAVQAPHSRPRPQSKAPPRHPHPYTPP